MKRCEGLDLAKILLALLVFLFHCYAHLGIEFGFIQPFIEQGPLAMTGFFILSGFLMYLTSEEQNFSINSNLKKYYYKRAVGILPVYYAVGVVYTLLWVLTKRMSVKEALVLAPIEFLGMQSTFSSLFSVAHNQGTWFISCLIICYLLAPLLMTAIKAFERKVSIIGLGILYFIASYAVFIVKYFNTMRIYDNPFFRLVEFIIGMLLCKTIKSFEEKNTLRHKLGQLFFPSFVLLWGGVMLISKLGFKGYYTDYNFFVIPVFCLIVTAAYDWECNRCKKLLSFFASFAMCFFLGQLFTWRIVEIIAIRMIKWDNDIFLILLSFLVCLIITLVLHYFIEKPFKKVFLKKD